MTGPLTMIISRKEWLVLKQLESCGEATVTRLSGKSRLTKKEYRETYYLLACLRQYGLVKRRHVALKNSPPSVLYKLTDEGKLWAGDGGEQ